ncbi:hypothetical protein [Tsukamurella ocularis]|uniref:hypothetical protein n=1 Tax=Tsukamurella ocularis TaxID=1970234 RepID=UPI002169D10E|nr:hypothetical protein [Tsukamurella ocularis]MCS3853285.1 hypothetical protein [Tsukamurella ocularis]
MAVELEHTVRDQLAALLPWSVYSKVRALPLLSPRAGSRIGITDSEKLSPASVSFWTDEDVASWVATEPMLIAGPPVGEWDRFEAAWLLLSDCPFRLALVTVDADEESSATRVRVDAVGAAGCGRKMRRGLSLTLGEWWFHEAGVAGGPVSDIWRRRV